MKIKKIIFPILAVLWMLLIFFFSSQDGNESSGLSDKIVFFIIDIFWGNDFSSLPLEKKDAIINFWTLIIRKGAHFTIFGILALLYYFSLTSFKKDNKMYFISIIFVIIYACFDEFHQSFTNGRTPKFTDVLIDTSGAVFFLLVVYFINFFIQKKHNSPVE